MYLNKQRIASKVCFENEINVSIKWALEIIKINHLTLVG
jgi:hypothetical protein